MIGSLLLRGMLVGLVAGVLSFAFLKVAGEPSVNKAIAFEASVDAAKSQAKVVEAAAEGLPASAEEAEPELVSRSTQAGLGLLTGVAIYSTAFGGLFALVFALAYGRMGPFGPRAASALLALTGFLAVYVAPCLKYPANPPAIGNHDTIGMRTAFYFAMILLSLAAAIAAWKLRGALQPRFGEWNAALTGAAAYLVVMIGVALALPEVHETPVGFPADVLWQFRVASLAAQAIMWAVIGLGFGALTERAASRQRSGRSTLYAPAR